MPNPLPSSPVSAEEPAHPLRPAMRTDGPALHSVREGCPLLAWGCRATADTPTWELLSAHSTSSGEVEYCKCSCDAIVVLSRGEVAALIAPDGEGPADVAEARERRERHGNPLFRRDVSQARK